MPCKNAELVVSFCTTKGGNCCLRSSPGCGGSRAWWDLINPKENVREIRPCLFAAAGARKGKRKAAACPAPRPAGEQGKTALKQTPRPWGREDEPRGSSWCPGAVPGAQSRGFTCSLPSLQLCLTAPGPGNRCLQSPAQRADSHSPSFTPHFSLCCFHGIFHPPRPVRGEKHDRRSHS